MSKTYVVANRDFIYTPKLRVRRGQVFALGGHRNDALLIKHRHVALLDPQPTAAKLKALPTCSECGRQFVEMHWRERCGAMDEMSNTERLRLRREQAAKRIDRLPPRMITVGA